MRRPVRRAGPGRFRDGKNDEASLRNPGVPARRLVMVQARDRNMGGVAPRVDGSLGVVQLTLYRLEICHYARLLIPSQLEQILD